MISASSFANSGEFVEGGATGRLATTISGDIKNAGAVGAALAGLHHLDYDPDNKLDVAVAAGNYRGKSATAMGLFYQPNEMMMVSAGATIGAGSVITKDTPDDKLTLARAKQVTIETWQRPVKK